MQKVGFGGGCHWCTEAVFQSLRGVESVEQGWIKSDAPFDAFSEAVIVTFDPLQISLSVLVDIHLRTHASQSDHRFRKKYRSAVYTFDERQEAAVRRALQELQVDFDRPIVTKVLPFKEFRSSTEQFQNYYLNNPDRPFCKNYIDPKLALLRRQFGRHVKAEQTS